MGWPYPASLAQTCHTCWGRDRWARFLEAGQEGAKAAHRLAYFTRCVPNTRWARPTHQRTLLSRSQESLGSKPDHPKGQKSAALNRSGLSFTEKSASPSKATPASCNIPALPRIDQPRVEPLQMPRALRSTRFTSLNKQGVSLFKF